MMAAFRSNDKPPAEPAHWWATIVAFILLGLILASLFIPSRFLARWPIYWTLEIDSEDESVCSNFAAEDDRLRKLDDVAPAQSFEQLRDEVDRHGPGDHYAWPDSLYECVVCLDMLEPGQNVRRLQCGHVFHSGCIIPWYLRKHYLCPICLVGYMQEEVGWVESS